MKSTNRKLLALCSAAVICAASYSAVELSGIARATTPTTSKAHPTKNAKSTSGTSTKTASKSSKTSSRPSKTAAAHKYKDGTYTGVGYTRIGAVQVSVTLKADKITNVKITGYTTHYAISYIDPVLPQELVQRQDINKIDIVSGATLSTEDFYEAVVQCLQQAQQRA